MGDPRRRRGLDPCGPSDRDAWGRDAARARGRVPRVRAAVRGARAPL